MSDTTWREKITACLKEGGESWSDVISQTLTEAELDQEFDDGYGGHQGIPFTLWTRKRVYFPVVYDGAEWVDSVSRNPDGVPTGHKGGE